MSFLTVHEDTIPLHPKDDPEVQAKGREVESARVALTAIERRARELELDRESHDELHALLVAQELVDLRHRYLNAKAALLTAQRSYDDAFCAAHPPWREYWKGKYREVALRFFDFLRDEAVPMNNEMLAVQEAAAQAGVPMEALNIPHLSAEAVTHRIRVGRAGLG